MNCRTPCDPQRRPSGCQFADRCPFVLARCRAEAPPLRDMAPQHLSACWRAPLDPELLLLDRAEGCRVEPGMTAIGTEVSR